MKCYNFLDGVEFECDETRLMRYLEKLGKVDSFPLWAIYEDLGVDYGDIANRVRINLYSPLFEKVKDESTDNDICILFKHCVTEYIPPGIREL